MNPRNLVKWGKAWGKKKSPEILLGVGIAGMVASTIWAVKATPKAMLLLEEKDEEVDFQSMKKTKQIVEVGKTTWKVYVGPAILTMASIACLIGSNRIAAGRSAAYAALYATASSGAKVLEDKIAEHLGTEKFEDVKSAADKEIVEAKAASIDDSLVVDTGKGNTLFYDKLSGQLFYSDIEHVKTKLNELGATILREMCVSAGEWLYWGLGLRHADFGDLIGWNVDDPVITAQDGMKFSSILLDDGRQVVVLEWKDDYKPHPNFETFAE